MEMVITWGIPVALGVANAAVFVCALSLIAVLWAWADADAGSE